MRATVKVVDNLGSKRVICVQALKGRKMKKGDIVYGMIGASPPRVHQSLTTAFCLADDSVDCKFHFETPHIPFTAEMRERGYIFCF